MVLDVPGLITYTTALLAVMSCLVLIVWSTQKYSRLAVVVRPFPVHGPVGQHYSRSSVFSSRHVE